MWPDVPKSLRLPRHRFPLGSLEALAVAGGAGVGGPGWEGKNQNPRIPIPAQHLWNTSLPPIPHLPLPSHRGQGG